MFLYQSISLVSATISWENTGSVGKGVSIVEFTCTLLFILLKTLLVRTKVTTFKSLPCLLPFPGPLPLPCPLGRSPARCRSPVFSRSPLHCRCLSLVPWTDPTPQAATDCLIGSIWTWPCATCPSGASCRQPCVLRLQAEGGQRHVVSVLHVLWLQVEAGQAEFGNLLRVFWVQATRLKLAMCSTLRLKLAMCSRSSGCKQKLARLKFAMCSASTLILPAAAPGDHLHFGQQQKGHIPPLGSSISFLEILTCHCGEDP